LYVSGKLQGEEVDQNAIEDSKIPAWHETKDLQNTPVLPLEVRDWLIHDLKKGLGKIPI